MVAYLRIIAVRFLAILAISSTTVAPAMACDNPWEDATCFWYDITGPSSF